MQPDAPFFISITAVTPFQFISIAAGVGRGYRGKPSGALARGGRPGRPLGTFGINHHDVAPGVRGWRAARIENPALRSFGQCDVLIGVEQSIQIEEAVESSRDADAALRLGRTQTRLG